jgi:hypothetical protein
MKIISPFLSTLLFIALTLPIFGQNTPTTMKKHDMSGMLGKPTTEATVKEVHRKVWLSTQKQYKKMMAGMQDNSMEKETKDATMAGTHHMTLVVTEAATGKELAGAGAKILILSPSGKNSTVDLKAVGGRLENGLKLGEKGKYRFTVIVDDEGIPKTTRFTYTVK